jgi:hypothetical protein
MSASYNGSLRLRTRRLKPGEGRYQLLIRDPAYSNGLINIAILWDGEALGRPHDE